MCRVLDFDHILPKTKNNQISNLYMNSKKSIIKEILKTRLICRHCHELTSCFQKNGKSLDFYYTKDEIKNLKEKLFNIENNKKYLLEINDVLTTFVSCVNCGNRWKF
jgi:DNA-directed RNA polymerase subunit M/transcription elongation factor TFIIS